MSHVLLRGGRVVDPAAGIDAPLDVRIREGRVAEIGAQLAADGADVLPCERMIVAPGFIDLHAHLRDPGLTYKECIATGTRAAVVGGFTTVCCMPNTDPVIDTRSVVEYVLKTAQSTGAARVLPIGAVTKGQAGSELAELADLADAGAVAFSDDGKPVHNSAIMRHALEYSRITGLPVIDHCEDPTLTVGAVMNEGGVSARLGLRGWPAAAEEIAIARNCLLAELTGGRVHIAHLSTAGGVALVRAAKAKGLPVTAEVTPHHLTLTDDWVLGAGISFPLGGETAPSLTPYDTRTKVNPPLRSAADVLALRAALAEGVIDAIATDHAPHAEIDKACEYDRAAFGISGLETALSALLALVELGALTLHRLVEALTVGPRHVLGPQVGERCSPGTLAVGSLADVIVIDPDAIWTIDPEQFASMGQNTPLAGVTVRGRVNATFVGGKVAHRVGA